MPYRDTVAATHRVSRKTCHSDWSEQLVSMQVTATDFKTHCLQYLDEIKKRDEAIFISKRGKVVAKLVPVYDEQSDKPWQILQNTGGEATDDLLEPVALKDWKLLK